MNKKVGFITLGCKVNIYESDALKEEFIRRGFSVVEACDDCDCYVINTCSVTNMADRKSRQMIRRCIKMNPNAVICAMGCFIQTNDQAKNIEGIDILIGNGNKSIVVDKIIELIDKPKKERYVDILDILNTHEYEKLGVTTYDHTRAFVKIQDGCNQFCAYCIIPYARGPVRCKSADDVIAELKSITEKGYSEVVLTGIHTGRYKDNDLTFTGLVKRILNEVPSLLRLRVSSIEIIEITDEFIEIMKDSRVIADHLHLPLQSGSNKILKLMRRPYTKEEFIKRCNDIKAVRPNIQISTDIIVGFPYEEEEDFIETCDVAKTLKMGKLHVFPYSMRKGTPAADMPQVSDDIKKDRAKRLISLGNELEKEYSKRFINETLDVIIEQKVTDNYLIAHSSNFLQIYVPYKEEYKKKYANVKITQFKDNKLYGEIIEILS